MITLLQTIKNTPSIMWSVSVKSVVKSDIKNFNKRRRSYGLTKAKAQKISKNTRKSYLDLYCNYKVKKVGL